MVPTKTSRQKLCSLPGSVMEVSIPCVASDEVMVYLFLRLGNGIIRPHCLGRLHYRNRVSVTIYLFTSNVIGLKIGSESEFVLFLQFKFKYCS